MHHIISVSELAKLRAHCQVECGRPAPEHLHVGRGRRQLRLQDLLARAASASLHEAGGSLSERKTRNPGRASLSSASSSAKRMSS